MTDFRKQFYGGNIKMNNVDTKDHVATLFQAMGKFDEVADVALAPNYIQLLDMARHAQGTSVLVGPQDIYPVDKGAYSGAIGGDPLKLVNPGVVILGHSERRDYFGEDSKMVAQKLKYVQTVFPAAVPVVCIGEPWDIRESEEHIPWVINQLTESLGTPLIDLLKMLVVAYEPKWAIGRDPATPEQAQEMHGALRKFFEDTYGSIAHAIRIIYGGAAAPDNIAGFMKCPDVDGVLVGGYSLTIRDFVKLIKNGIAVA